MSTFYKTNLIDDEFTHSVEVIIEEVLSIYREELNKTFNVKNVICLQKIKEFFNFKSQYTHIKATLATLNKLLTTKVPGNTDPFYTLCYIYQKLVTIRQELEKEDTKLNHTIEETSVRLFNNSLVRCVNLIVADLENNIKRRLDVATQPYFTSLNIDTNDIGMTWGWREHYVPRQLETIDRFFKVDEVYLKGATLITLFTTAIGGTNGRMPDISIETFIKEFEKNCITFIEETGWCFYYKLKANLYAAVLDSKIKGEELVQQLRNR